MKEKSYIEIEEVTSTCPKCNRKRHLGYIFRHRDYFCWLHATKEISRECGYFERVNKQDAFEMIWYDDIKTRTNTCTNTLY